MTLYWGVCCNHLLLQLLLRSWVDVLVTAQSINIIFNRKHLSSGTYGLFRSRIRRDALMLMVKDDLRVVCQITYLEEVAAHLTEDLIKKNRNNLISDFSINKPKLQVRTQSTLW
jgi:hypothetical protein